MTVTPQKVGIKSLQSRVELVTQSYEPNKIEAMSLIRHLTAGYLKLYTSTTRNNTIGW